MKKIKLMVLGLLSWSAQAQQPFTLDEAVQTALKKNQLIQAGEYQVEYFRQIRKTASDIGKLSAIWMHGQYNSIYQDNNLTFAQTIPFPTVLLSQSQLGTEQVIGAQKTLIATQNELAFEVKSVYYQLLFQEAFRKLLQSQDSLYSDFSRASSLRFKTGETNLLEKTTTESQWMEVKNQLRVNNADILIAQTRLQSLLKNYVPVGASEALGKRKLPQDIDTVSLAANPQLSYLVQQAIISQRVRKLERNRILPDIMVGYFTQSLIGIQNINGRDQVFGSGKQFQGLELGISIPLWAGPQLARNRASAINEQVARKNADHFKTTLNGALTQALQEIDKNLASLEYYQASALKNAELLLSQSRVAYTAGQIGYMEYLQSLKNAIAIKSNYLLSLNQYNQSVVKVEYLLGKF